MNSNSGNLPVNFAAAQQAFLAAQNANARMSALQRTLNTARNQDTHMAVVNLRESDSEADASTDHERQNTHTHARPAKDAVNCVQMESTPHMHTCTS